MTFRGEYYFPYQVLLSAESILLPSLCFRLFQELFIVHLLIQGWVISLLAACVTNPYLIPT